MWWLDVEACGSDLVVHEWGTFTAVAGGDGAPVTWHPLAGGSDLPAFVYGSGNPQPGLRGLAASKGAPARVRMETPVLYFYASREQTVDVGVRFVDGQLTEWYPRVREFTGDELRWGQVRVLARDEAPLPTASGPSHYWAARDVSANELRVCDPAGDEHERFLFYRGLGSFPLSVQATAGDADLRLWTTGSAPGEVLVFERAGDRVGFARVPAGGTVARPLLDDDVAAVEGELGRMLVEAGLYRAEADAMLATWHDDWWEPGLRVLYLVPRAEVDARLPLTLDPAPKELVRVLVGRLEVPTPQESAELAALLAGPGSDADVLAAVQARFGRFAEPWLRASRAPRARALLGSAEAGAGTAVD